MIRRKSVQSTKPDDRQRQMHSSLYGGLFRALALTVLLAGAFSCPVIYGAQEVGIERYEVFHLRHITAAQGKQYLTDLQIGTVSSLPGAPMLLVTAGPTELTKARSVLGLVDSTEPYVIREIATAEKGLLLARKVGADLGNVMVGTMSSPPEGRGVTKAIIDVHGSALIAIAPASSIDRVVKAFSKPKPAPEPQVQPIEIAALPEPIAVEPIKVPAQPEHKIEEITVAVPVMSEQEVDALIESKVDVGPESNGVFGRLLDSLAAAEKRSGTIAEPIRREPEIVARTPEAVVAIAEIPAADEVATSKHSPEPATEPIAPVEEAIESVPAPITPVIEPAAEPITPASETEEPAVEPAAKADEVEESAAPADEPKEPSDKPAAVADEPTESASEPPVIEDEPVEPVVEPIAAVGEPNETETEQVEPVLEPVAPVNEPKIEPVTEAPKPVRELIEPAEKPIEPVQEVPAVSERDAQLEALMSRIDALEAELKAKSDLKVDSRPEPAPKVETKPEPAAEVDKTVPKVERPAETPAELAKSEEVPTAPGFAFNPDDIPNGDHVLKISLPEKLSLIEFLDFVGQYLDFDYIYDPEKMKTINVNLRLAGLHKGEIKVRDLYKLLEAVLHFHGFVMTEKDGWMIVRPLAEVGEVNPKIVDPNEARLGHGDIVITTSFKLKHIDTTAAETFLGKMKLGVNFISVPETSTLIVTGYAHRMKQIGQLMELVDKPGKPKGYKSRQLKFTLAETLAPKIKTLAEQIGTVSVTVSATVQQAPTASRTTPTRDPRTGRLTKPAAPKPKAPTARTSTTAAPKQAADTVYLEADARTNRILMIGHDKQLKIVENLIDSLDVEQQDLRLLRLYKINNVDAEEVRFKLEELGIVTTQTRTTSRRQSSRDTRRQTTGRTPPGTAQKGATPTSQRITGTTTTQTAANEQPLAGEPQVVILETVNSLLVNATPEQHVQIAMIIGYVDSEPEDTVIPYIIYQLENQDPELLAEVLNQLIQETTEQQDPQGKIQKTVERRTEEDIIIIADKNTFSLIVYASKKNQAWIKELIKQLDKRRPQVLIDATLVQITKDDAFNFDLNMIQAVPNLEVVTDKVFDPLEVVLPPGVTGDSGRNHFLEFNYDTGQGFYADEHINALLTTMVTKKYGRIMARPKLLVNDNETGTIQTVDTTYVERTTTNVIGTDNPTSTQSTQFDDYSAGITMEITPHISEGDMLRLEIILNRSGFTSPIVTSLVKPPNKSDADVSTIVTVPDRSTIILGGLEKIENSKGGDKIPILGDLPLIGGLFREIEKNEGHDKLYVFVKAHILRPGGENALADLKEVSRKNRETFERLESEMLEYNDWPGLDAEPMDPMRVLEAD